SSWSRRTACVPGSGSTWGSSARDRAIDRGEGFLAGVPRRGSVSTVTRKKRKHAEGWPTALRQSGPSGAGRDRGSGARGGRPARGGARLPVVVQRHGPHGLGRPSRRLVR